MPHKDHNKEKSIAAKISQNTPAPIRTREKWSPYIHFQDTTQILSAIEQSGVNAVDEQGRTLLLGAILYERASIVNFLLARGADVNHRIHPGDKNLAIADSTPLMEAVKYIPISRERGIEMIEMLLQAGADPALKDVDGRTALDYLSDIINPNVKYSDQVRENITECRDKAQQMIAEALAKQANVSARETIPLDIQNPLALLAILSERINVLSELVENAPEEKEDTLDKKTNVPARETIPLDIQKNPLALLAILAERINVLSELVENAPEEKEDTLDRKTDVPAGKTKTKPDLFENTIPDNTSNDTASNQKSQQEKSIGTKTPQPGRTREEWSQQLFAAIRDPMSTQDTTHVLPAIEHGDINAVDEQGRTPLLEAILLEKQLVINLLLARGADIDHRFKPGDKQLSTADSTPLMEAVKHLSISKQRGVKIIQTLLDMGANPTLRDADNRTAFDYLDDYTNQETQYKDEVQKILKDALEKQSSTPAKQAEKKFNELLKKLGEIEKLLSDKWGKTSKQYKEKNYLLREMHRILSEEGTKFFEQPDAAKFVVFNKNCTQLIDKALTSHLTQHRSTWKKIHPILKGILGVLATLTVIPALAVIIKSKHGYTKTFFEQVKPTKIEKKLEQSKSDLEELTKNLKLQ